MCFHTVKAQVITCLCFPVTGLNFIENKLASVIHCRAAILKQFNQSMDYSTKWENALSQKNSFLYV